MSLRVVESFGGDSSESRREVLWINLLTPFDRDGDFLAMGRGVLVGEGLTRVVLADEFSEFELLRPSVDSLEKSSSRPPAPTTALTRIAGARAAVPGSFQKFALDRPEWERVWPEFRCLLALLGLEVDL